MFLIHNISQVVDSTGGHTVRECEPSSVAGSHLLVSSATTSQTTSVSSATRTSAGTPMQATLQSPKLLLARQSTAVPLLKVKSFVNFSPILILFST